MLTGAHNLNILLVYLANPKLGRSETEKDITEIWNLVGSMGDARIADLITQKDTPHPGTYIGQGKALEVSGYLKINPIDIVLVNGLLTPGQKFNLTKIYWDINPRIRVWDRVDLILAIFSRHAHTA